MAKDKFKEMQKGRGGAMASFQNLAATVAAIENQQNTTPVPSQPTDKSRSSVSGERLAVSEVNNQPAEVRYMRLPNPQIPIKEYNLISAYCSSLSNMTRQDWIELAFIEKLHNDHQMSDEEFHSRQFEIRNRPPRGQRKGLKAIRNGQ